MSWFRKVFITGELDLYKEMKNAKSTKAVTGGALSFASLSSKKISSRFDDIRTDLYLAGITSSMPKITMEQISNAEENYEESYVEENTKTETPSSTGPGTQTEDNLEDTYEEDIFEDSGSYNTKVKPRANAKPRTKVLSRKYEKHETIGYVNKLSPNTLQYILGHDENHKLIIQDLREEPHLVIAGKTGSGKTVTTFNLLVSLAYNNTPATLKLSLIDLKLLTFGDSRIANSEFLHGVPPALDAESALEMLRAAHTDMMERYAIMMKLGVKDYRDAELFSHVIVIDEIAELLDMGIKEISREVLKLISSIASMGRQGGVFLVIATQSPTSELLSGKLRSNLNTIGHLVSNSDQAKILGLTDKEENPDLVKANNLKGKGDGLKKLNGADAPVRFQATYIETKENASYQFF